MGDNLLMKKLTLFLMLLTSLLVANDLSWVDEQVDAIKPPRSGERNSNINKISDPFIFLKKNGYDANKKNTKKSVKPNKTRSLTGDSTIKPVFSNSMFRLAMIINNSALINSKWYKVGDWINKYKIIKISKSSVTLKQNSIIKVISTVTKNNNLKFKR